ncbi:MAG: hypothetical protein N3B13_09600, partial [Deltaproteobacteria bacterium]|nr:hypothetical protein [Deltaproteobacteria bacterium]
MMPRKKDTDGKQNLLSKSKEELLKLAEKLRAEVKKNMTKVQIVKIIGELSEKAEDARKAAKQQIEKSKESARKGIEETKKAARKQIDRTKKVAEKVKSVSKGIKKSVDALKKSPLLKTKIKKEPEARIILEQVSEKPVHGTGDVEHSKYDMGDMSRRKFVEEALGTLPETYDIDTIYVVPR